MSLWEENFFLFLCCFTKESVKGVSYASFAFSQSGRNLNMVTTGIMQMTYEESSNIISM